MAIRYPKVPENITVHLGPPDSAAKNIFEGRNVKKISNALKYKFVRITDYSPDILVIYTRLV